MVHCFQRTIICEVVALCSHCRLWQGGLPEGAVHWLGN